jgi:hypothetical protein
MRNSVLLVLMVAWPIATLSQDAQTVDALKKELQELRQRTEQLENKLKQFEAAATPAPNASTNSPAPMTNDSTSAKPTGWSAAAPIAMFRAGNSYMNVSANALFAAGGSTASDIQALQPGGHDPIQRGFTLQGVEATFDGAVDPFLRAQS